MIDIEKLRKPYKRGDLIHLADDDREEAADEIERLRDALIWCSGSADFGPGGQAREGWLKCCAPLICPEALQDD